MAKVLLLVLLYPIRSYWRFIRNLRWPPPPSWIFKLGEFGTFCHVDSVVPELCTKLCSNICYSHWDRRYFVPDIHYDDVTSINFWFRLLVTWPSSHGRDPSSHKIWCRHLSEIKRWRLPPSWICWGAMGPPTKAHSWCVPPVKISP